MNNALLTSPPSRTVVTSFTPRRRPTTSLISSPCGNGEYTAVAFEDGEWVLCLATPTPTPRDSIHQHPTLSCALSNGQIQVYDQERLQRITSYSKLHGDDLVTDLVYSPSSHSQSILVSSGNDGSVCVLDTRQSSSGDHHGVNNNNNNKGPVLKALLPRGQAALSVSLGYDGSVAAVATNKASVHFLDLRAGGKLVGSYVDGHTDEITQVRFQPGSPLLVTGAEDGLACVFDTTQSTEEAALKCVLNVGTPLRRVGFCGSEGVYCLTGSETASLWNFETAFCIQDYGVNLRENLSQATGQKLTVNYLVDAYWDAMSQELLLTAGNFSGDCGLFRLLQNQLQWEPCNLMTGGHRGVVRAACHLTPSIMITAGEDARLVEWKRVRAQSYSEESSSSNVRSHHVQTNLAGAGGGGPLRRQRNHKSQSSAPY